MNKDLPERVLLLANHIFSTHDTIRKTAKIYGLSKSTVHNDISKRLYKIDRVLFFKVHQILDLNFAEKHLRGGEATKQKYLTKDLKNNSFISDEEENHMEL